ncbi:hypothetical protein [Yersinia ruckeri]|uniref:hypothetical protein n=1 Tax=Yersinia ruckeri TaxID=29486 RepID=UPI0005DCDF66|nr:hypothetical protein [Yersinia ruckeri]EKN3360990.1 hypothetical protein [Yersinia ruckeri]EKN3363453.1 hypothetical protein [Yersinia ruckeri]EKN4200787.1 hypothetical protein [Yersinia ruckeri]EKN4691037.1 hypothetical protein [Yersinia ruckeri]EKN4693356.1 hypothetical protein [Yersinia ruckeri]
MKKPISVAPLLWRKQEERSISFEIKHGKGQQGIVIRPDGRRWTPPKGALTSARSKAL